MDRVAEALLFNVQLLRMPLSEDKLKQLQKENTYYRTLLYSNAEVLEKYLHLKHEQALGHPMPEEHSLQRRVCFSSDEDRSCSEDEAHGGSGGRVHSGSSSSSGSDDDELSDDWEDMRRELSDENGGESASSESDGEEHEHQAAGALFSGMESTDGESQLWIAKSTNSPCAQLERALKGRGFDPENKADFLTFVHMIRRGVHNFHDLAHVYHHLRIDRYQLESALHPESY
jgi:hypothetical protein